MHTTPGPNDFSSIHRFSKSVPKKTKPFCYSDEDVLDEFPSDDSDFESAGSQKARALGRLHNACVSLGAAPCWPDWLDTNCRMQADVSPLIATDSAEKSLLSLSELGVAIQKRYFSALEDALDIACQSSSGESLPVSAHLLHLLLASSQQARSSSGYDSFHSYLSILSQTNATTLKSTVSDRDNLPNNRFASRSVQRIRGADSTVIKDPNIAELRANGQWEMILAEAIRGSSLQNSSITVDKPALKKALEYVSHWKRLLGSVVSAMVPTAALLRFGLHDAKGRRPHPLCNDLPESALSSETIAASPSRSSTQSKVGLTMKKAISFLSRSCAFAGPDNPLAQTSQAAANHLLENVAGFSDMVSLQSIQMQINAIEGLFNLINDGSLTKTASGAAFNLLKITLDRISRTQNSSALFATFGLEGILQARIISDSCKVELKSILSIEPGRNPFATQPPELVKLLLVLLSGKEESPENLRLMIAQTLCRLIDEEDELLRGKNVYGAGPFRIAAATALIGMTKAELQLLMSSIFYEPMISSTYYKHEIARCSIKLLISLVTTQHKTISGKGCKIILDDMTESIMQWSASESERQSLTRLVCILATRFGTLPSLINHVLSLTTAENNNPDLTECIRSIFQFVVELQQVAGPVMMERPDVDTNKERNMSNTRVQRRTCTFTQTGEGFAEQHWYNCYTCGLLWDKARGCCSLCARVCHKDHDVGYSRKSSFFCDCGAEVTSGARQKCKCLSPVDDSIFNALNECTPSHREPEPEESRNQARLVHRSYPTECTNTLKLLTEEAKASQWNEAILALFNRSFKMNPDHIDFSALYNNDSPVVPNSDNGKPCLDLHCGVPLVLKLLETGRSMLPVRAAKSNTIKIGVLSSSSTIHMRRHRTGRYLMESDMRGRLICAESNSLSFFNAIPSIHTRHVETPYSSHLSRSQLSCLGTTEKINFDVQGLSLSGSQNLLVVWGSSKACVMVLSRGCCAVEQTITLALQFESDSSECESEYLIRCLWLTDAIVVVVCGTVIHLFDLATTDRDNSCKAVAHFALAYEDVLICSAVLTSDLSSSPSKDVHKKLVILLDSGRIHFIDLFVDSDGVLEEEGETYIEIGTGISFPSAGIRRYFGGEPTSAGSTSTTLGEGTSLHFLQQSNLLLYQCVSSPVVAMLIDKNGAISGTFELLPSTISSDNLQGSDLGVVTGPYLHFQELGTVNRDGVIFYRVSCVARVSSSNQQKILLLEFNQTSSVSVKELLWPPSFSAGLGSFSSNNFVGSCTLSIPYLIGGLSSQGTVDAQTEIFERVFLSMLSSNGSILWFGEDCNGLATKQTGQSKSNTNNIYMFEESSIFNVSEEDCLVFSGEYGKDSNTLKKKLSLNNSEFLSSSSRDGCTLTARLECTSARDKAATDLAIVAVRVLVGSMPDLIPREISIMGKVIKTKRNTKRWYDFVFTDEEILLAIRSGLVTVNFSSSHDLTSGAVIDCVEVYAKKRSNLEFLDLDSKYKPRNVVKWQNINKQAEKDQISCIKSLTSIAKFSRGDRTSLLMTSEREAVKQILKKTALDSLEERQVVEESLRSSALSFLKQVEEDEAESTLFIHDSTLKGLFTTLMDLGKFLKSEVSAVGASKVLTMLSNALDTMIHIMRISSDIARGSTENYKAAMISITDELTSEDAATGKHRPSGREKRSLAVEAKKILDYAAHLALVYGSTVEFSHATYYLSDLILIEMLACSGEYAQFDTLSEYLMHDDSSIVESCCKAVISIYTDLPKLKSAEDKSHDNPDGYVTYQCDACKAFPIKDIRYTIEGEVDIDLCRECFEKGCTYASSNSGPLVIHGRTLCVEDEDMQCESIWQMKGIVISAPSAGFPMVEDVEAALKMSQTNKKQASSNGSSVDRETFKSQLFTNLLSLISKTMAKASIPPPHLINLVLGIVQGSKSEKLRIVRGRELLKHTTDSLSELLQTDNDNATGKIVFLLRVLSSLITKKTSIEHCPSNLSTECDLSTKGHSHKSKTDPRFICDVHKVPAVRRRCSHGIHKNRRFYVCGLERKHRCTYFRWADDQTLSDSSVTQQSDELHSTSDVDGNHPATFEPIQIELNQILDNDSVPAPSIQSQFCSLIRKQFELLKDSIPEFDGKENASERPPYLLRNEHDIQQEIKDGIIESRRRLGKNDSLSKTKCLHASSESLNETTSLISESLWLFSLAASPQNPGSDSEWHPVLCSIITGGSPVLIHLAKRYLKKLCGGDQDLYHRICDQYVYGYQFRKLLRLSEGVLDFALIVREMAKQCGDNWRNDEVEFSTLPPAGLFGVGDLISEDCLSVSYDGAVQQILDELLATTGTDARKRNWRNFCFQEVPRDANQYQSSNYSNIMEQLVRRPPIICILWLSSCLRGSNQVKMLQLVDIALPDVRKNEVISTSHEDDMKLSDALTDESTLSSHEQALSSLNVGDLHAFVVEFVINGRSKDLRCVAARVATKLAYRFSNEDKNVMMGRFVDGLLRTVAGKFGRACKEFIELLEQFVLNFNLDLSNIATRVTSALHLQLTAANHCISKPPSSNVRFDLANCVHCHNKNSTNKSSSDISCNENEMWVDDQLRPCVKSRLESSTLSSAHSEYSSFYQLKFRVVLSEIQLTVSDPRGRLVKNVGVYFSPRPVADVSMLKNDKYNYWQRCGTLSLARHATSATLKLKVPVVAANLKIKYEDFYNDKSGSGSTRSSDGTLVLLCPRCTRQVNNAHGVCGNCGEVAFQCRKCRHINYDRLDAFLCVECGYCTSGGFSYDITVGMALNAVAVIDEDGYQRSVSMLRIANKRHVELRNNLKKKLLAYSFQQGKINGQDEHIEEMALYGPHLKRAFLGKLPKMNDESESKVSSSNSNASRQVDSSHSLTSSRARSLLSLARQLRNDSAGLGGDGDRLSRSELLQQALLSAGGSEISSDILDEINETVFGSADHSLTRAIASLNDRNQQRTTAGEESARAGVKEDKKSTTSGESSRIYSQMREAERECYELTRRIEAWNRLNEDALATTGPKFLFRSTFTFQPTSCSKCSPHNAMALMTLLLSIYSTSISQSEQTVTPDLIKLLITEPHGMNTELKIIKRKSLIALASNSEYATKFILDEIKLRLTAVQDITSAELLGQIIQLDFPSVGGYIDLAVTVLQG